MAHAAIGVDIVEITRMEGILSKTPSFAARVFTDEERLYCESKARPAAHYVALLLVRLFSKLWGQGSREASGERTSPLPVIQMVNHSLS